jgi:urease subunit alpha
MILQAAMGDPNASIPTPQPVLYRPMFGAFGGAPYENSLTFLSHVALDSGLAAKLGLRKKTAAVRGCRRIGKRDMRLNDALPRIDVNPETYEVRADGVLLRCEPAEKLPMSQRYFLF